MDYSTSTLKKTVGEPCGIEECHVEMGFDTV
jgi:hypothetical protein